MPILYDAGWVKHRNSSERSMIIVATVAGWESKVFEQISISAVTDPRLTFICPFISLAGPIIDALMGFIVRLFRLVISLD